MNNFYCRFYSAEIKGSKLYVYLNMRKPFVKGFKVNYEFFVRTLSSECKSYSAFSGDCSDFKDFGRGYDVFKSLSDLFDNSDKYLNNGTLIIGAKVRFKVF